MRSLDTNARRSSTGIDFRPSAQLAKCHKTTTNSSLRQFQKVSGKLVAFKIYLGFLALAYHCCHAMQVANRRSIFLPFTDNHMIGVLTPKSGKTRTS
jgi:hypothetical protein